ncbi:MAG: ABC transporter permease, partial [bacterium]
MIRHLWRLFWVRRRVNGMLLVEVALSFIVLFAVVYLVMGSIQRWNLPTGFDYHDRYVVYLDWMRGEEADKEQARNMLERGVRMIREAKAMPGVLAVGTMDPPVYGVAYSYTDLEYNGRKLSCEFAYADVGLKDVFDISVENGRWFEASDESLDWRPVIITRQTAKELFGDEEPLGKIVDEKGTKRVVGVIEGFRPHGELAGRHPMFFLYQRTVPRQEYVKPLAALVVHTTPGMSAEFEHDLLKRMQALAPDWSITVNSLENMRTSSMRLALIPIVIVTIIAAFLLIMVVLGMVGVFWQAVISRVEELGLRRAFGGTRTQVRWQILGEVIVLTL